MELLLNIFYPLDNFSPVFTNLSFLLMHTAYLMHTANLANLMHTANLDKMYFSDLLKLLDLFLPIFNINDDQKKYFQ